MENKKLTVVYDRVSSAAQSLELQNSAARRYLESQGLTGNEDYIDYLSDHDVSATKLKMSQRPKLMELMKLIQEGKVEKVIGYKRDRFARNFYEFVDITKIFIKYNVEVVYTASNEPPFRSQLSLEAFYGMFGQMEGENIRTRTNDARKQFPSSCFGYTRIKEKEQVRYEVNEDKKDIVVSLFNDFAEVQNDDQFLEFLLKRRKGLTKPEKMIRLLTNPFYAAQYETKNGLQALPHVEPMISVDLYSRVNSKLMEFMAFYQEKLVEANKQVVSVPLCGECNSKMKHLTKNPLDVGYFVCSDNHKRLAIPVEELNALVTETVQAYFQSISNNAAKRLITKQIVAENKRLSHEKENTSAEYLELSLELSTLDRKNLDSISAYLEKIQTLKNKFSELENELLELQVLSNEIKSLDKLLLQDELRLSEEELPRLIDLLVNKVLVHDAHISVELFLSQFAKEVHQA